MKNLKSKELIAYASSFASFVLPHIDVTEIILYGSAARHEASKDSDVDIFFNTKNNEKETKETIKKELEKFYKSSIYETWSLKGITNQIKIEVGDLETWQLKRSIISDGIVLYGKYKILPEKLKAYTQFNITPIKKISKRNKIIRVLFGRKEKSYETLGLMKTLNGKRLSPTSFIVPLEKSNEIIKFLSSEKVDFTFFELWSDQIY